eukprot:CAMPEP_0113926630 /NCGR_PEP_ID=MMETSP1159-20121227/3859_1 /TAXON_ID=88271 /ORGANISM="Picocystis salinarum" /LENGTH=206 /DNA_ID=CAMNT_0000927039 /DNA_START=29 /DNA_END=649 /DNA_ORIENTATION=+ /assembly_acc=CAM_ASM_000767
MPRVKAKALFGGQWVVDVGENASVEEVRKAMAEQAGRDEQTLWIVFKGRKLLDLQEKLKLKDGDSFLVVAQDKRRMKQIQEEDVDEIEKELRFRLPGDANRVQKFFKWLLKDKMKLPEHMLALLFGIRRRTWIGVVVWGICSHFAGRFSVGPLYILTSIVAFIFLNLGQRREGEMSAYSVFNEGFRELPGTLNADTIDNQIRQGQF